MRRAVASGAAAGAADGRPAPGRLQVRHAGGRGSAHSGAGGLLPHRAGEGRIHLARLPQCAEWVMGTG